MKRFVLTCKPLGVYLGINLMTAKLIWTCMGDEQTGRGSLPNRAITWTNMNEVQDYFRKYGVTNTTDGKLIEVECLDPEYATVAECFKAGIPMWNCFCVGEC